MIKRNNPINKNKKELAKELLKIKAKQISKMKSDLKLLISLKSKLIDLKVNNKDGIYNQIKLRYKLLVILEDLLDLGIDKKVLENISKHSLKDLELETNTVSERAIKSNEKIIKDFLIEINKTIIELKKKIRDLEIK